MFYLLDQKFVRMSTRSLVTTSLVREVHEHCYLRNNFAEKFINSEQEQTRNNQVNNEQREQKRKRSKRKKKSTDRFFSIWTDPKCDSFPPIRSQKAHRPKHPFTLIRSTVMPFSHLSDASEPSEKHPNRNTLLVNGMSSESISLNLCWYAFHWNAEMNSISV